MDCAARQAASARVLQAFFRPRTGLRPSSNHIIQQYHQPSQQFPHISRSARYASSSSGSPSSSKPIVLEKPDKFRPPSHAARRNARSTTSMYGAGAAYNQGMSETERQASEKKNYPHMFPAEGTTMYWFLTTRWVHVVITMVVLITLAGTSVLNTWSHTSPYSHLIPPLNMMFFHPFTYFSEVWAVYRLHLEYTTQQVAESRRQNILDAQKRRLYRRSHGMEDLEADEVSGVDVRGLVEWDDGLTKPERERGGQYKPEMIGAAMQDMGQRPGEDFNQLMARKREEQAQMVEKKAEEKVRKEEERAKAEEERLVRIGAKRPEQENRRPKLWLGIW